ncbi:serine/threonine protein kinase [bacterium]|nr:serine/threonine protein kinase [bacterium]
MNASQQVLEAGTQLANRYNVEFVLGQGGMGAVYLARDLAHNGQPVALKEMRVQTADAKSQRQAVEQFHQEARFLYELDHPNLVKVSDFFFENGRYYLIMDYIQGKSLADLLKEQSEPFNVSQVLEWAVQLADVLAYLHGQDPPILFRDMKPSNILLDSSRKLRLIDFGIARSYTDGSVTATFIRGMGSADYCPLEQCSGGTDPRSDIYSLGATLFHLLTLQVPPRAAELASGNKPVPSPRRWNSNIPPSLEDLIVTMLAVRKNHRCESIVYVQEALAKIILSVEQRRAPKRTRGVGRARQNRHWAALAGLTIGVLGLLVWLAFQMLPHP